jgi:8-oxo-dGTP pyrophosphatase MutT (NUDIX family)
MLPASDPFASLRRRLSARKPQRIDSPTGPPTSVALILVDSPASGLETLLMERAKNPDDPWSGHISLPGGRWEEADPDRLATSIRETEEETGIVLRPEDLLGELDDLSPSTPSYPALVVRPFVFGLRKRPALAPGPEAAECFWIDLDALPGAACEETFIIAGKPRRLPAFRIGARIVWGITYRILSSFLEIAGD